MNFTDPAGALDAPFTATVDCGNGAGAQSLGPVSSPFSHSCSYASVGSKTVTVTVTDKDAGTGSSTVAVSVVYQWSEFFRPVGNLPTMNIVKAGSGIPVKFSLSGDQGLNVLATGSPSSVRLASCSAAETSPVDETVTAGASSLLYDPTADQYTYIWKTEKAWGGTCRQLTVKLNDGTEHKANFQFTR